MSACITDYISGGILESINNFDIHSNKYIGLKNINRRLKLLYGDAYGLQIESEFGKYTICEFSYPKNVEDV